MSHQLWNEAIGRHWFQSKNQSRSIILVADATFLESVAHENDIPLDGSKASQHFIDSVRQDGEWKRQVLPPEQLPATSAYLALAILAVSHMDGETRQGMTSYWMPFNELYGHRGADRQIPRELKSIWLNLWHDVQDWANEKNGGKYGFVRFPDHAKYGIRDPHKNIRLPKSQALLKLEDLKRLTGWFDRLGLQPGENLSRRWVTDRVRENLSDASEFSVHARRVFRDDMRFDAAVDQLLSFFADWDGAVWSPDSQRSQQRPRSRLVFAFRTNKELVVGVQQRRDSNWTTESKHCNFPISQATTGGQRQIGNRVAAVWCNQSRLFVQSKLIAANDQFLIFIRPPSYLASTQDRTTYVSRFLEDLRRVSNHVEPYASSSSMQRNPGWGGISELQQEWCMFSGTANEQLNASQLTSRTKEIFAPDVVKIRVVGGVKIDRKHWLAGVGPALRIDGPQKAGVIHCSTYANETRKNSSVQFENGKADMSQPNWPLDNVGVHRLWAVGNETSGIEVRVAHAKLADAERDIPGWKFQQDRWCSVADVGDADTFVTGALIVGEPFSEDEIESNRSRELIDAIVSITSPSCLPKHDLSNNPLVTQLRRAALARN